jgi:tripartite-type tricarboxylate transporter receptor subunit TctC
LGAPKHTPAAFIAKLNSEINLAFADPKFMARISELGGEPLPGSSSEFGHFLSEETNKWGKIVRFSGAKPD